VDARLAAVVQRVAEGVAAGCFLPVPGLEQNGRFENCRLCSFDRVCAVDRDERWERKRDEPLACRHGELAGLATAGPEADE
jgi:hypothetical protein